MLQNIVIVGAGQAAAQAIDTLRRRGYGGSIVLVGDEPYWPYQRPPLSKKYLLGAMERDRLLIRPAQFYADRNVDARLGKRVEEIDRRAQRVLLNDGTTIPYDALLLATGSQPRQLPTAGNDLAGVCVLRTIEDAERMRPDLQAGKRVVIVGGGYIGLEVAASCREVGIDVTVLEMTDRVMSRVVCKEVSAFYESEHARHGVRIICGARVSALTGDTNGHVRSVICEDGTEFPADVVLVGVGVQPCDMLAARAGLECSNGIVVDEYCRTTDPHIYAAGDCTNHPSLRYGKRVRLESVDNAFEQGTSAALNMLGTPTPHNKVPWFWSDQYDLKLIIVGLCTDHDSLVIRGNPQERSFSACYLREGELVAIDTVNNPRDQMAARKLVAERARPNLDKLANPEIALKDCV